MIDLNDPAVESAATVAGRIRAALEFVSPERLVITVEDDGPGLPADRRDEVLKRGAAQAAAQKKKRA